MYPSTNFASLRTAPGVSVQYLQYLNPRSSHFIPASHPTTPIPPSYSTTPISTTTTPITHRLTEIQPCLRYADILRGGPSRSGQLLVRHDDPPAERGLLPSDSLGQQLQSAGLCRPGSASCARQGPALGRRARRLEGRRRRSEGDGWRGD